MSADVAYAAIFRAGRGWVDTLWPTDRRYRSGRDRKYLIGEFATYKEADAAVCAAMTAIDGIERTPEDNI